MLEYEIVKEQVGKRHSHKINKELIEELNRLNEDPDYGEEFVEGFIEHFNVLDENKKWRLPKYINAMKFYMLRESGHSRVDAFIKVFPQRLASVLASGKTKADMTGESSRYDNTNGILQAIKSRYNVNMSIVFRGEAFKSINALVELRDTSPSDRIRMESAIALVKELKPTEDININVNNNMGNDMLADLSAQLAGIANKSLDKLKENSIDLKQLGKLKLNESIIDVEAE